MLYHPIFKKAVRVKASCVTEDQHKIADKFCVGAMYAYLAETCHPEGGDSVYQHFQKIYAASAWEKLFPEAVKLCQEGRF